MNTQTQKALKMAIEYLTNIQLDYKGHEVRKACKEALEQPAQEPVAWMDENGHVFENESDIDNSGSKIPLYTHPAPSWQGLTTEEIQNTRYNWERKNDYKHNKEIHMMLLEFARAIEQALKEKNT